MWALVALGVHVGHAQVTVDLSAPFAQASNLNANPGADALHKAKKWDVYGFAVVQAGALVASAPAAEQTNVWSVTKTWVATLIGQLVQQGRLDLTTTLEVALPDADWSAVSAATDKQAITIAQMLSMSSGLSNYCNFPGDQTTVEAVLNSPTFEHRYIGKHFYLCSCAILSYVIHRQTGKTPLEFASDELFPALGIARNVTWQPVYGSDGIQESGLGLHLGPLELAKLGQLYRQGGVTGGNATARLLPASFTAASSIDQLEERISLWSLGYLGSACRFKSAGAGYGFMKWIFQTESGPADCALGHQGQFICSWPELDLIIAITSRDDTDYTSSCELLDLVASGLDFQRETTTTNALTWTTATTTATTLTATQTQTSRTQPTTTWPAKGRRRRRAEKAQCITVPKRLLQHLRTVTGGSVIRQPCDAPQ